MLSDLRAKAARRIRPDTALPNDLAERADQLERFRPFTMTSDAALFTSIEAARHVAANGIEGDIVECGVWRGGHCMAMASELAGSGRTIWLYDTFTGMPKPSRRDRKSGGDLGDPDATLAHWEATAGWCEASIDDVRANMASTGYPHVRLVQGLVEDTIPGEAPERIAVLRLDTDFYESTRHELEHLYPRLSPGGILIVDDYGAWRGAREAVDERFGGSLFLARIDHTVRVAVKPAES